MKDKFEPHSHTIEFGLSTAGGRGSHESTVAMLIKFFVITS